MRPEWEPWFPENLNRVNLFSCDSLCRPHRTFWNCVLASATGADIIAALSSWLSVMRSASISNWSVNNSPPRRITKAREIRKRRSYRFRTLLNPGCRVGLTGGIAIASPENPARRRSWSDIPVRYEESVAPQRFRDLCHEPPEFLLAIC